MFTSQDIEYFSCLLENIIKVIITNSDVYRGLIKPNQSSELIKMIDRAKQELQDNYNISGARDCLAFVNGALWALGINFKF